MQPAAQRTRPYSFLQALLSLGGFMFCALCALGLLLFGSFASADTQNQFIGLAWVFATLAALAVPAFWYALRKILGRADAAPGRLSGFPAASLALLAWPLLLVIGSWVSGLERLSTYLLPAISALAVGLPLWWLIELTGRGMGTFSPRRKWGALNFSLFFSTPTAMIVELTLLFVGIVAVGVLIGMNADASVALRQFYEEMTRSMGDTARLQALVMPLLANPWVILATLLCFAVVVPLLEELLKPLAVLALLGLGASPADGLVLGAIAGAGFGLTETLFSLSSVQGQMQWLTLIVGRAGTNLLHITTTALIGWALVSAWRSRKFARLGLAYLCAAFLHGLWNTFSLVSAMAGTWLPSQPLSALLSYAALAGLLGLGGVFLTILLIANRRLRAAAVLSGLPSQNQTPTL